MFKDLIKWSKNNFSHLPWRENRSLYRTLVSEIMLQQTTVGTVINHFERFCSVYPDLKSLANSTEEKLLIEWKGLGYYRRARNLKKIAEQISITHNGRIPDVEMELLSLNGVGAYTANAILSIGMDKKAIAVDANLERVLSRIYGIQELKGPKLTQKIYELFNNKEILSLKKISFRELNEALMDLGRVYCKSKTVECQNCPVSDECIAYAKREQLSFPRTIEKKKVSHELKLVRFIVRKNDKVLVYQKKSNEWLHGQWELPTYVVSSTDEPFSQYPKIESKIKLDICKTFKSAITKYKIENVIYEIEAEKFKKYLNDNKYVFKTVDRDSNFSTASIKALKLIKF
jgi:A/G-specific adenine glycosylase